MTDGFRIVLKVWAWKDDVKLKLSEAGCCISRFPG